MYPSPSRQKWKSFYPRYSRINYTLSHLLGYHNQDITGKADFPFNYSTTVSTFSIFTYACAVGTPLRWIFKRDNNNNNNTERERDTETDRQTDRQRQRETETERVKIERNRYSHSFSNTCDKSAVSLFEIGVQCS